MIINPKECEICEREHLNLERHSINGNNEDKREENLMEICKDCHFAIHFKINYKKKVVIYGDYPYEAIIKISELRKIYLKSRYGSNYEDFEEDYIDRISRLAKILKKLKIPKEIIY